MFVTPGVGIVNSRWGANCKRLAVLITRIWGGEDHARFRRSTNTKGGCLEKSKLEYLLELGDALTMGALTGAVIMLNSWPVVAFAVGCLAYKAFLSFNAARQDDELEQIRSDIKNLTDALASVSLIVGMKPQVRK